MTMTFEEFFKKKRIDLAALQSGEPGLYSEFEKHFNQMGEKSFDHTKKYWFNQLRLLYHLAPELKPEKVHIENRLAEQTITESLLEEKIPAPSVGFKPRFKAGVTSSEPKAEIVEREKPAEVEREKVKVESEKLKVESPEHSTPKSAGFTPRFKAGVTKTAQVETTDIKAVEQPAHEAPERNTPKPAGFKPRFNMKTMAPKPVEDTVTEQKGETPAEPEVKTETAEPEAPASKPAGFKPRFNVKMMKPKPPEEEN